MVFLQSIAARWEKVKISQIFCAKSVSKQGEAKAGHVQYYVHIFIKFFSSNLPPPSNLGLFFKLPSLMLEKSGRQLAKVATLLQRLERPDLTS